MTWHEFGFLLAVALIAAPLDALVWRWRTTKGSK